MTASHIAIGVQGEKIAEEYLALRGYRILARNVKTASGEIDIIARIGDTIVFVEVKANRRSHVDVFRPSIRVDAKKLTRLQNAAELWLEAERNRGADLGGRIDIIEVCGGEVMEHFEDVTM